MAQDEKEESGRYQQEQFKGLIRKNGQGWPAEKYGRMGLYVYLYNRIKGRPTKWGLDNEDVSFRIKDVIQNRFDEVYQEYIGKHEPIKGMDISKDPQRSIFLSEINQYNEHAQKIDTPMPDTQKMSQFLQAVADDKNDYFMTIHKSVQEKSGEYMDEKNQKTSLIYERYKKQREIDKQKYDLRRDNFWTGLKGAGAIGSGGLTVGAGVALFLLPLPINIVAGLAGGAFGFAGLRNFGLAFIQAVAKNIKMRQRLRDLKNKGGAKGDRGLKEIEKAIAYNKDLKAIMTDVGKKMVGKDGKMPTQAEFEAYIKKNYPKTYKMMMSGEYMGNMKKFYEDSMNHYQTQEGGSMRAVMGFMERHAVSVTKNDELAIERDDLYKSRFNVDGKKVKLGNKGQPIMDSSENYIFENGTQTLEDWKKTDNLFQIDEKTYQEKMPREYQELKQMASQSLYNIFRNSIFETPYASGDDRKYSNYMEDKRIKEFLENNPDGDKTQIIRNAVQFLNIESRMDKYDIYDKETGRLDHSLDHSLDGSLGVSVQDQLLKGDNYYDSLSDVCNKLLEQEKDDSGVIPADIQAQTNAALLQIEKALMSNDKLSFDSLKADINAINSSKIRHYLTKMMEVKKDEARITETYIDKQLTGNTAATQVNPDALNNIKSLIANYKPGGQYSEIVQRIIELTNPADIEISDDLKPSYDELGKKLMDSLRAQVEAAESKERNNLRAMVLEDIQEGRLNKTEDLQEYFKEIDSYDFDKITNHMGDIMTFYTTKIVKASSGHLKDYIEMRLRNKLELIITQKLTSTKDLYTNGDEGIKSLRSNILAIQSCKFLTKEQKDRIMSLYSTHVKLALDGQTKQMQLDLLNEKLAPEYRSKIQNYFNKTVEQGGLSDFFRGENGNNPKYDPEGTLVQIGSQLEVFRTLLSSEVAFQTSYGDAVSTDGDSQETSIIVKLLATHDGIHPVELTDKRKITNIKSLISEIKTMKDNATQSFSTSTNFDFEAKDGKIAKGENSVFGVVYKSLYDLKEGELQIANDPRHKLVYLLMLKRQAITAMKGQVRLLLQNTGSESPEEYLRKGTGADKLNQIRKSWGIVCSEIDKELQQLVQQSKDAGFDIDNLGLAIADAQFLKDQFLSANRANVLSRGTTSSLYNSQERSM